MAPLALHPALGNEPLSTGSFPDLRIVSRSQQIIKTSSGGVHAAPRVVCTRQGGVLKLHQDKYRWANHTSFAITDRERLPRSPLATSLPGEQQAVTPPRHTLEFQAGSALRNLYRLPLTEAHFSTDKCRQANRHLSPFEW